MMKRLSLLLGLALSTASLAADNPISCEGNGCDVRMEPRTSGGTKTASGVFTDTGATISGATTDANLRVGSSNVRNETFSVDASRTGYVGFLRNTGTGAGDHVLYAESSGSNNSANVLTAQSTLGMLFGVTAGGSVTANVANGRSFTISGDYTASSATNDFLVVQRSGGAVKAAIGYDDGNGRVYVGSRTNHPVAVTVGASGNTAILVATDSTVRLPVYTRGLASMDSSGVISSSNVYTVGATLQGSTCTASGSNACAFTRSYGGGITGFYDRTSVGVYNVNFTASFWSDTPVCTASSATASAIFCSTGNADANDLPVFCFDAAGAAAEARVTVTCTGPR